MWKARTDKIGFSGTLTGRGTEFGTRDRNAAQLAVYEINKNGGIKGRPLVLITKDDKNDPDTARKVDQELIDAGVVAIIGHPTSHMTLASVALMNTIKMLMISPTTSTTNLTGIDDYFIRVTPDNRAIAHEHADYTYHALKSKNAVLRDRSVQ